MAKYFTHTLATVLSTTTLNFYKISTTREADSSKQKMFRLKKKLQPNTTIGLLSECLYEQLHDYLVLNKRIENKTQSAHDKKAKSILCLHFHIFLSNNNNIMLRSITDLHPLKQLLI